MKYADINRIYQQILRDMLPWNIETPPAALTGRVRDGMVSPCRTIDL